MSISSNYVGFLILFSLLIISIDLCSCTTDEELVMNGTLADLRFFPAVATWYGSPTGAGSGGACGFENDVANGPYYGMISAGNRNFFRSGVGCGTCYLVKCTNNPACSGSPIAVTITDECPGACNNEAYHLDLSGKAFGSLAKPGQADSLRKAGRIDVQYTRIRCRYRASITFKIDAGSNKYYLSFAIENVNGYGEISGVEILASNRGSFWVPMQRVFGQTWKFDIPEGVFGPYSVRLSSPGSKPAVAGGVIPADWAPRQKYSSNVNFASF